MLVTARRLPARVKKTAAFAATIAIVASGLTVIAAAGPADAAVSGVITGTVFRDYNDNGVMNTGNAAASGIQNDVGAAGIQVTAVDRTGATVSPTTTVVTAADGTYSLPISNAASSAVRVTFSTPSGAYSVAAAPGATGTTKAGARVQYVQYNATGVNYAFSYPEDYSQAAPPVVQVIQYAGAPSNATAGAQASITALAYNKSRTAAAGGQAGDFSARTTVATFGQTGAIGQTTYSAAGNDLFAAAEYKRDSGLYTTGSGATEVAHIGEIFRVANVYDSTQSNGVSAGTSAVPWLDVTSLGINVGTVQTNTTRQIAAPNAAIRDTDAFAKAGKVGIGAMAVTADGKTLYFINLFDKKLYALDISNRAAPSLITSWSLGLGNGQRANALTIYRGNLYVGYNDTGETGAAATANPGQSASSIGMNAYVTRTALPTATSAPAFSTVFTGSLGYAKGDIYGNVLVPQSHQWNSWTDAWSWNAYTSAQGASVTAGLVAAGTNGGWHMYPSPLVSSLYFDEDGYLSIGITDRSEIQGGNRNMSADASTGTYETGASGDTLIAAPNAAFSTFTLENNGIVGTRTSAQQTQTGTGYINQGPTTTSTATDGHEFYNDAYNQGNQGSHKETTLGSLAGIRGTKEVVSSVYDPLNGIRLAGDSWFSVTNGQPVGGYEQTPDNGTAQTNTFQKGGGLGAVQLLSQLAPVQIGDRVWFDADQDGKQQADEPGLAGVTVVLKNSSGTQVATTTTDSTGYYQFTLQPNTANDLYGDYTVTFTKPSTGNVTITTLDGTTLGTVPWTALSFTSQTAGTADGSDPDTSTGVAPVKLNGPGTNTQAIDAGYKANATFSVKKTINAAGGSDTGTTYSASASAVDFRGSAYTLPTSSFSLTAGQTSSDVSVPLGTKVTVSEAASSSSAQYKSNTISPSGSTLVSGSGTQFVVDNTLYKPGFFSVKKTVSGAAAASIPSTKQFTIDYSYTSGTTTTNGTLTVKNDGVVVTSGSLPYGTPITLSEETPTGPNGVTWKTPKWTGTGVTDNGDGTAKVTIGDGTTIAATIENPVETTPAVDIETGDGTFDTATKTGSITHDADDMGSATYYNDCSARTIVTTVTNTGNEALKGITITDSLVSGPNATAITYYFPDGTTQTVTPTGTGYSLTWNPAAGWAPGDVIYAKASLVECNGSAPHVDKATVTASGFYTNTGVTDTDAYNALSGRVQVIEYDARQGNPAITDGTGAAAVPTKPLTGDATWDANTVANSAKYPVNAAQQVCFVVSNNSGSPLTNLSLSDATTTGPALSTTHWYADLSGVGGPNQFDFRAGAVWNGVLKPNASFIVCTTLTLPTANQQHTDTITVNSNVAQPAVDGTGKPTGEAATSGGNPVLVKTTAGANATVTDNDPFNAVSGRGPFVDIEIGSAASATATTIQTDADTAAAADSYNPAQTKDILVIATNTGDEALCHVTLTIPEPTGAQIAGLTFTFPDGSTKAATKDADGTWSVDWTATDDCSTTWAPDAKIYGHGTLTMPAAGGTPHFDTATVDAQSAASSTAVTDSDPYYAYTKAIDVIDYLGTSDPTYGTGTNGTCTVPTVPAAQDANTVGAAVDLPVDTARPVHFLVTNSGGTSLTNIALSDVNASGSTALTGPFIADLSAFGGPSNYNFTTNPTWTGVLPPCASFVVTASLKLGASSTHHDTVSVTGDVVQIAVDGTTGKPTGGPALDSSSKPITTGEQVSDSDPFFAKSGVGPKIEAHVGDGTGTTIAHEGDTMADGVYYDDADGVCTTKTIVLRVTNTGSEALDTVSVNDVTLSGTSLGDITWKFPDGSTVTKPAGTAATWDGPWAPGDVITGTATLKLCADSAPHVDELRASGTGVDSGTTVSSTNRYYAYSGAIQVIEYDGSATTPDHGTGTGTCVVPSKTSLTDVQDADTTADSASWPTNVGQTVRYIVTNTGTTTLTHLVLGDTTDTGATITGWTADLTQYGGGATDSVSGPLDIELPPCASFVVTGTLKIPAANTQHTDHVDVVGTVVVPAVDVDGLPTGQPAKSGGALVTAKDAAGNPITVDDTDPFNALSDNGPHVDIEEGDGSGATYEDADTMTSGSHFDTNGGVCDTKTVTFTVKNTGDETLTPVKITDTTVSGKDLGTITWTFPNGTTQTAAAGATVTYTGDWAPNDTITGTATLTLCATDAPHVDKVTVVGTGKSSGDTTTDTDFYNAYPGAIQVIEYDGDNAAGDPTISDGTGTCHVPGPLSAAQDANTEPNAAIYAVGDERTVRMVVTNTSTTSLTNVNLSDFTDQGTDLADGWTADLSAYDGPSDYSFVDDGPWTGVLPPCASFFVTAHLTLGATETHEDHVDVTADVVVPKTDPTTGAVQTGYATDGTGAPLVATDPITGDVVTVDDTDPFWAETGVGPRLVAHDGNGTGTGTGATITHEGDTMTDGTYYATPTGSCVTKPVVFTITNNGSETLTDVVLHDTTISGPAVQSIVWTFPDGSTQTTAADVDVTWAGPWAVGETIYATSTLTLCSDSEPHVDALTANANSAVTGDPADPSTNYYNAYPGAVQIIEYDGNKADPTVSTGTGTCTIPADPMADPKQDADTGGNAVVYPITTPQTVRMVVTNTSTTYLTNVDVTDITDQGTPIDGDWTADLSAFGGPSDYSFVNDGPWDGILPPCASFFITATLELGQTEVHVDHADVTADVIVPAVDPTTHAPTGDYAQDGTGAPVLATDPTSGDPIAVTDTDPFNARTGNGPAVDIEKGDGTGSTIAHDADTMADAAGYADGETRTIVFDVTNTGDEALRQVVLTDTLVSGAAVVNLEYQLPDGTILQATKSGSDWVARWTDTFGTGTAEWKPNQVIVGHASLTMHASDQSHVDRASVSAVGAGSSIAVSDSDDYDAVTGATQVIKYDSSSGDPAVKDGSGNWIVPQPTGPTTVTITSNDDRTIKWVVTNTGTTYLTNIMVKDVTLNGRSVNADWTADLSAFGGSSHYSFVKSGPWKGLLPPGASFFSTGTLEVEAGDAPHRDRIDVTADVVAPGQNPDGTPTDTPGTDPSGNPIVVEGPGTDGETVSQTGQVLTIAPRGALAFTGMEPLQWIIVASAMLLIGAMLLVFAPKRRRRH